MDEIDSVLFNLELGMEIQSWLTYFNTFGTENKKDHLWKFNIISKYLKGIDLSVLVNVDLLFKLRELYTYYKNPY